MMKDPAVSDVLSEYRQRMAAEDILRQKLSREEWLRRRDEFLLEIGEDVGTFLHVLIRGGKSKRILEVGTSYGYSTLWLADAARATGGQVITLDLASQKQAYTKSMIEKAGLADFVQFRCGDAIGLIRQMNEIVDFVLIDLWKDLYTPCFEAVLPKLAPGAFVVADNMIYPPDNHDRAAEYRAHIRRTPGIDSVLLPIGHGIEVSRWME